MDGKAPVGTPAQVLPGSTVVYQIDVVGVTPSLSGFQVVDHVPANATFTGLISPLGTPTNPPGAVIGPNDFTISGITSDGSGAFRLQVTFQISATAPCGSTITNSASFPLVPDALAPVVVACP